MNDAASPRDARATGQSSRRKRYLDSACSATVKTISGPGCSEYPLVNEPGSDFVAIVGSHAVTYNSFRLTDRRGLPRVSPRSFAGRVEICAEPLEVVNPERAPLLLIGKRVYDVRDSVKQKLHITVHLLIRARRLHRVPSIFLLL